MNGSQTGRGAIGNPEVDLVAIDGAGVASGINRPVGLPIDHDLHQRVYNLGGRAGECLAGRDAGPRRPEAVGEQNQHFTGSADALFLMDEQHSLEHQQALDRARAAAEKAVALDPRLPEAHVSLGVVLVREYQWKEAEQTFRRAIELNPNSVPAHAQLGFWLLLPERRWDEAVRELRRAVVLDALSTPANTKLAYGLLWSSRFAEAEEQARRTIALDPLQGEPYIILMQALYWQKREAEALAALGRDAYQRTPGGGADAWLACIQVRAGHREAALKLLK